MNEFKTGQVGLVAPKEIPCVFCKEDMKDLKWHKDYELIPWRDDPEHPESFNKLAMTAHIKCFERFKEMNRLTNY